MELDLESDTVSHHRLPIDVKSGSRAAASSSTRGEFVVLENGSSRVWLVSIGETVSAEELTTQQESRRFRSSLGSRLLYCETGDTSLLVTGTPGGGAHTPWLFSLGARTWARLPDAPHPILSSAGTVADGIVTIVGGWSKQVSCHGHIQVLKLRSPYEWTVVNAFTVPWRRPGAGTHFNGQLLLALGWMEGVGQVGTSGFRLLKRNGGAQRAATSSSRLCAINLGGDTSICELAVFPFADSFEHSGEIFPMAEDIVCIGRDHIQAFNMSQGSWRRWRLPPELGNDGSNSWVKHCGSWALACIC